MKGSLKGCEEFHKSCTMLVLSNDYLRAEDRKLVMKHFYIKLIELLTPWSACTNYVKSNLIKNLTHSSHGYIQTCRFNALSAYQETQ